MTSQKFKNDIKFIKSIIEKNGPDEQDYEQLNSWYDEIGEKREKGELNDDEVVFLRQQFEEAYLTPKALQGFVFCKPHGYHGDHEIIDRIYNKHTSDEEKFAKWDTWFHTLAATKAVRNRKEYFKRMLEEKVKGATNLRVLNLASGPCRDIQEFYKKNPSANVSFDCVEIDPNAVKFAKSILGEVGENVNFILANIFKFDTEVKYDLIWSAGLFDYFDDKTFAAIINRYKKNIVQGGEFVIGNFHPRNSSRRTMEFGLWYLNHRDEEKLLALAQKASYDTSLIDIDSESEGVNLFMKMRP